jgi:3-hydroxy-9,10-secoandrosta-1,3,5(10)-triene-9,17-dione monooxygenase
MSASVRDQPIPVPEPGLTPAEMVERARALRPWLREEQRATEDRGRYSEEIHEEFRRAGFYRCLQPRRFGGYEFGVGTFYRVVQEISCGCPSTGWMMSLAAGHALLLASHFPEQAQAQAFGPDGEFLAPSVASLTGTAAPGTGGWRIEGTWSYCSGAPYANYFMPCVLVRRGPGPAPAGIALIPREQWTMLDDWGDFLGMRGSGSNTIVVEDALVPDSFVAEVDMLDVDVSNGTPGTRLHANPLYGGRCLSFFHGELVAIMVGVVRAALEEYEEIIRTRTTLFPPFVPRYRSHAFQRPFGLALGLVEAAETLTLVAADRFLEYSRRGFEGGDPFSLEEDVRGFAALEHAGRLLWEAGELLVRTAGSGAAKDGQRLQMYYRDLSVYRSHLSAQYDSIAERLAQIRLGLVTGIARTGA